jgi:hypothetical protein
MLCACDIDLLASTYASSSHVLGYFGLDVIEAAKFLLT